MTGKWLATREEAMELFFNRIRADAKAKKRYETEQEQKGHNTYLTAARVN